MITKCGLSFCLLKWQNTSLLTVAVAQLNVAVRNTVNILATKCKISRVTNSDSLQGFWCCPSVFKIP